MTIRSPTSSCASRGAAARSRPARSPTVRARASRREEALAAIERDGRLVRGELRPAGPSASGAIPTCSGGFAGPRSRGSQGGRARRAGGPRPLPPRLARSRPGRGCARRWFRSRASPSRSLWEATSCPGGARLPARLARSALRLGGGRLGRRGARASRGPLSARTRRSSAGRARSRRPRARPPSGCGQHCTGRALLVGISSRRRAWRRRRRCPRSGSSSGRERSRTTPGSRCAPAAATLHPEPGPCARGALLPRARRRARRARRWSLTSRLFAGDPEPRALAELLLERQGIVTRTGCAVEGIPGGYAPVYRELRKLETLGVCRRGYFVEGLGGAQFALPGAVERLREQPEEGACLVLAAADPPRPTGQRCHGPGGPAAGFACRRRLVVTLGGEAALFVEQGGDRSFPYPGPRRRLAAAAARRPRRARPAPAAEAPRGGALRPR